jgi:5-methylcytosine-specific restriction protein A
MHKWTEHDDILVFYIYRYGTENIFHTRAKIAESIGISVGSLSARIGNFKFIDGQGKFDHSATLSHSVYDKCKDYSESRLRSIAFPDDTPQTKKVKYTTEAYIAAFRKLNIAPHYFKMLQAHYYSPDRTMTATQMAKAMGYINFNAANLHYGKLGKLVGETMGWVPVPDTTLYVLAEFEKLGHEWHWIMRPQVAHALERLGWINSNAAIIPEEIENSKRLYEGTAHIITVNAYERSAVAREKCILHYGCKCSVCDINMADVYGELAQGHIHVHHLRQLSKINKEYQVDPLQDLRPVCPNCHAIIHLSNPPKSIEEVKALIAKQKSQ